MVEAYHQSSQTLNILRAFSAGGFADISRLHSWNLDFAEETEEGSRYRNFAAKVDESLRFNRAIGIDTSAPVFEKTDFYIAHDCLCLPYEGALTRQDSITGNWYDCSAHLLVLDEPTYSDLGSSAHVEFVGGVHNPLALRVTDRCDPKKIIAAIEELNPVNDPSRLSIIVHMSPDAIRSKLPRLVRAVQRESKNVLWIADPSYGDAVETEDGIFLSRDFEGIRSQLRAFFDVLDMTGAHPGGVSLDMTGEDVAELKGGVLCDVDDEQAISSDGCDPRLGGRQALELAFLIAERMRLRQGLPLIE
uniref:Phospho-2-dehydro-3-deoxyheptonate aldolase n=1 Tax=Pseudictyota dubia TaxID=2749911 RepID=A0A7R9YZJ7_9STRA